MDGEENRISIYLWSEDDGTTVFDCPLCEKGRVWNPEGVWVCRKCKQEFEFPETTTRLLNVS